MQKYCAAEFTKFSSVFEHLLRVPPNLQGIVHNTKEKKLFVKSVSTLLSAKRQNGRSNFYGKQIYEKCRMVCLPYSPIPHRP